MIKCCRQKARWEEGEVYVGRFNTYIPISVPGGDGYFGNIHTMTKGFEEDYYERKRVVDAFELTARREIQINPRYRDSVAALYGKDLFCWCDPEWQEQGLCHAHVLEKLANELHGSDTMAGESPLGHPDAIPGISYGINDRDSAFLGDTPPTPIR